ncbi:hypothetical protein FS837_007852 [Tulasnella sp. UAMH 9824]|nr:hypothetical protein FS837_007852 [Tulasnella sp. UAMH 9824]
MHHLPPPTPRTSRKPKLPQLIPPSETVDLPANIFVTSIDVEADLWHQRPGTKRAKTAVSNADKVNNRRSGHGRVPHEERTRYAPQFEEDVFLNYGDPEDTNIPEQVPDRRPHKVDWEAVEADFRSLPMADVGSLAVGAVVAWQALGIDSSTLTPAMLLHLGEVLSVSEDAIEVGQFQRPNSAKTIGFGLRFGQDASIEDQDEPEVLACRIEDAKDWRLVQPPPTKV